MVNSQKYKNKEVIVRNKKFILKMKWRTLLLTASILPILGKKGKKTHDKMSAVWGE